MHLSTRSPSIQYAATHISSQRLGFLITAMDAEQKLDQEVLAYKPSMRDLNRLIRGLALDLRPVQLESTTPIKSSLSRIQGWMDHSKCDLANIWTSHLPENFNQTSNEIVLQGSNLHGREILQDQYPSRIRLFDLTSFEASAREYLLRDQVDRCGLYRLDGFFHFIVPPKNETAPKEFRPVTIDLTPLQEDSTVRVVFTKKTLTELFNTRVVDLDKYEGLSHKISGIGTLSVRLQNILDQHAPTFFGDLIQLSDEEFLAYPNSSPNVLEELKDYIDEQFLGQIGPQEYIDGWKTPSTETNL